MYKPFADIGVKLKFLIILLVILTPFRVASQSFINLPDQYSYAELQWIKQAGVMVFHFSITSTQQIRSENPHENRKSVPHEKYIRIQRIVFYLLGGIVLLILLLGYYIYHAYQVKKRTNRDLIEEIRLQTGELQQTNVRLVSEIEAREKYETELSHSEKRYRQIFNATNETIIIHDAVTGKILDTNIQFEKMFGYSKDDASHLTISDLSSGKGTYDQENAIQLIRRAVEQGPQIFEWQARCKSGELFWTEVSLFSSRISDEKRVIAVVRDISLRKEAEDALKESEEKYRTLFNSANDAIFLLEKDHFVECNSKTLDMFGCNRQDILGESPVKFSPVYQPDGSLSVEKAEQKINAALMGHPQTFEWQHIQLNGTLFNAEVSLNLVNLKDKKVLLAMVRDVTKRKEAEKALRESEEKYRMIIENAPSVFWITDRTGKTHYISPNVQQIYGFTQEEVYEKGDEVWLQRIHEDDINSVLESFKNLFETGDRYFSQYRIQHKNGEWIWLSDIGEQFINEEGKELAYGVFTDITEQKKAETALKESEEKFSKAFHTNPSMMSLLELPGGRRADINLSYVQNTGYSREELLGKRLDEIPMFPPNAIDNAFRILKEKGHLRAYELEMYTRTGESRNLLVSADLLNIAGKEYVLTVSNDITERLKAQHDLKESEAFYRSLYENISDSIAIMNVLPNGELILSGINPAEESVLGIKHSQLESLTLRDILPENSSATIRGMYDRCVREKEIINFEEEILREDTKRIFSTSLIPLKNEKGDVFRIIRVAREITEKKQAQQREYRAIMQTEEKERSRIAKDLHDGLGPILSTIKLYVDWLLDPNKKTENTRIVEKVDLTLREAMTSLKEISNNLSPHILENYGLVAALNSFIEKLREAKSMDIQFETNIRDRINENIETTLYRIITECIHNTLKYANAKQIKIRITEDLDAIAFEYSDDGVGFVVNEVLDSKKGMGLNNILYRMGMIGGTISIKSQKNKGTFITGEVKTTQFF